LELQTCIIFEEKKKKKEGFLLREKGYTFASEIAWKGTPLGEELADLASFYCEQGKKRKGLCFWEKRRKRRLQCIFRLYKGER